MMSLYVELWVIQGVFCLINCFLFALRLSDRQLNYHGLGRNFPILSIASEAKVMV